jgi:hypothetical protein
VSSGTYIPATYRVVDAIRRRVSDRKLVDQDPFLERLDVVDDSHAGTGLVEVVGDIVDDWTPILQVAGCLVGELLTVLRIALIRVVSNKLPLVWPERRLSALASRV